MKKILLLLFLVLSMSCFQTEKKLIEYANNEIKIYSLAIKEFYNTEGRLPDSFEELAINEWVKVELDFKDPWGNKYLYKKNDKKKEFDLISFGPDRKEGGTGINKDIVFHYSIN